MKKFLPIAALVVLLPAAVAYAGGSVDLEQVTDILKQRPELSRYLLATLEFEDAPNANIRLGPQFKHLSGGRMGPYRLMAKPKGQKGKATIEVTVCTDPSLLDAKGKPTDDELEAVSVKEKLLSVIIRDVRDKGNELNCPTLSK